MNVADYTVRTEALDADTCWRLLMRAWIGRVGFLDRGEPTVLPVNCGVVDRLVVFRTGRETALCARGAGAAVAFEVDHTDRIAEAGWSVLVKGRLWEVTDPDMLTTLKENPLHPWAEGTKDTWMKIVPAAVTGRITSRHLTPPVGPGVPFIPPD